MMVPKLSIGKFLFFSSVPVFPTPPAVPVRKSPEAVPPAMLRRRHGLRFVHPSPFPGAGTFLHPVHKMKDKIKRRRNTAPFK